MLYILETIPEPKTHVYFCRLPFAVLTISSVPLTCESDSKCDSIYNTMYLLSEASAFAYYLMDVRDGSYRKIIIGEQQSLNPVHFAETVDLNVIPHNVAAEKLNDLEERKLLQSDACLVLHASLQRNLACMDRTQHTLTTLYLTDRPNQSVLQILLQWMPSTDNITESAWESLSLKVIDSAPLALSGRAIGMGYNSTTNELAVTGENKHVYLYATTPHTLIPKNADSPTVVTSLPRLLDYQNAVVFLIHKPLGVLSSAKDYDSAPRGTVYDVAGQAGFPVNIGLVGRLDGDTSGIMVFTNDGRLNARILHPIVGAESTETDDSPEENVDSAVERSLSELHLHPAFVKDVAVMKSVPTSVNPYCAPDENCSTYQQLKQKEYLLTLLQGKNNYCLENGVFNTAKFEEEFGQPLVFNRYNTEFNVKEASIKVLQRYQDPRYNPNNRDNLGWVIQVLVNINEGKHKQIRRLAKRAGYITVGLERTSMCGGLLSLESVPKVGQCRWLGKEEKLALYKGFQLI